MAVLTLEDREGRLEVVVFPKVYERCSSLLGPGQLVLVNGRLDKDEENARMRADRIRPITALVDLAGRSLSINLNSRDHNRETLQSLSDLFKIHSGPSKVCVQLDLTDRTPALRIHAKLINVRIRPSEQLGEAVEEICGAGTISWR